jgi:hypothetical protein
MIVNADLCPGVFPRVLYRKEELATGLVVCDGNSPETTISEIGPGINDKA